MSPQNLGKQLKKSDLGADMLMRCSLALDHDFFADLSAQLRKERPLVFQEPTVDYKRLFVDILKEAVKEIDNDR